ncbi:aromatic amino acid lyase [Actinoplanes sp. DH11]|uniref:aromatic amino acid lyase n=1 Tax=Actinoplanes sp. DH11 TaxID=2857011 RepID=UPI001E5E58DA|nr:aromatic amino acid lyase [Actinoplanes sp. DH11]
MVTVQHLVVRRAGDLDPAAVAGIACGTLRPVLGDELLAGLRAGREAVLAALGGDEPVYGVNTGMGAMAGIRLDAEAQQRHQNNLMAGRAVGSAPWLSRVEARAVLAVRLRTLLHPAAGASPELCAHLAAMLAADVVPAIPARGSGAAGEIIPLAHAGAALIGTGQVLDAYGYATDAAPILARAGLAGWSFGTKEGVAFLEGVPALTGLSVLAARSARLLIDQVTAVVAAEHAVARASTDPWHPAFAAGDPELRTVLAMLDTTPAAGGPPPPGAPPGPAAPAAPEKPETSATSLQAPVSFRVSAPALAVALRATAGLEAAVDRALTAVTDSPAYLDGRFVGSAGFAGTDLVAAAGTLTGALVHLAELGAARLHRLLDPAVTGLNRQLSHAPGAHAGMVAVHKRAVGVAHRLRRFAGLALVGPMETSAGQEDVQSFGFEAAECLTEALDGLREVVACEILAVHQATRLRAAPPEPSAVRPELAAVLRRLPAGTEDRPFGRDLDLIIELLRAPPSNP